MCQLLRSTHVAHTRSTATTCNVERDTCSVASLSRSLRCLLQLAGAAGRPLSLACWLRPYLPSAAVQEALRPLSEPIKPTREMHRPTSPTSPRSPADHLASSSGNQSAAHQLSYQTCIRKHHEYTQDAPHTKKATILAPHMICPIWLSLPCLLVVHSSLSFRVHDCVLVPLCTFALYKSCVVGCSDDDGVQEM